MTVRNKKRVGYTYELTLKIEGNFGLKCDIICYFVVSFADQIVILINSGEWLLGEEKKTIKGDINIPEFSFGELDDLQV